MFSLGKLMIDKITIHVDHVAFTMVPNAGFTVKRPSINMDTAEEYRSFDYGGMDICGAYCNTEYFNLNITNHGAYINFNPMKIINGHNYRSTPLTYSEFSLAIEVLKEKLVPYITGDIDNAEIQKLELPCDTVLDQGAKINLGRIKATLEGQYLKPMNIKGCYIGNASRDYCFYNKTAELLGKQDIQLNTNVFRVELRLKKKSEVTRWTPFKYLKDFYQEDRFEQLPYCFASAFFKDFKVELKDVLLDRSDEMKLKGLMAKHKRGYLDRFLMLIGVEGINKKFANLAAYRSFLRDCGATSDAIKLHMKKVRDISGPA